MEEHEVKLNFSALTQEMKAYVLALWAHNVTVSARAVYPGQVDEDSAVKRLVAFNEIEHLLTGQLAAMLAKDDLRYSDDDLIRILFSEAQRIGCEGDLVAAFKYSILAK